MQHGVKLSRGGDKLRCGSFAIGMKGEFVVSWHRAFLGCCCIDKNIDFENEIISNIVLKIAFLLTLRAILRIIFLIWYCGVVKWIT